MAHPNYHLSSLSFVATNKFNSFWISKSLIVISVVFAAFPREKTILNVTASKTFKTSLSSFVAPYVAADSSILAISNFTGNNLNRNKTKFDIRLQRRPHEENVNDLSPFLLANCSRTGNFARSTCDACATKLTARNRRDGGSDNAAAFMAITNTVTNTLSNLNKNLSSLSSSTSSSSSLLFQHRRLLSRPKRYLSFPEGSSFSVAVCFTVGIIGNPRYNYMSFGLNWGVAYDLPNASWILNHLHGFAKQPVPVAVWHRRSRRSLYKEIENVVNNMGYNGRECILRALCEGRQYFQKTKMSMIGEMLRAIFSLPKQRLFSRELAESGDIMIYDRAYRSARSVTNCSEKYECKFSLLELAFGKYSTPPDSFYTKH